MSVGTREEPEKVLDSKLRPRGFRRISRKRLKIAQNRKDRRHWRADPEAPLRKKYLGYEW